MGQRASEFRHRVLVQRKGANRDEDGYPIPAQWSDYLSLWAKITHLSGRDLIAAQSNQSKIVARMKIRYREDIDTTMRVVYKGKHYAIDSQPLEDMSTGFEYVTFILSQGTEQP